MFIQTEATPNPATMKFLPGCSVLDSGTLDFLDARSAAEQSPLAAALFGIEGVKSVFFGSDFVTVSKDEGRDWQHIKPAILCALMEHFVSGKPVLYAKGAQAADAGSGGDFDAADAGIVQTVKELLETRVRPAVARDGGDISFHGYRDGVVFLHMRGSCAGCPSSTVTLKNGIENLLRHFIPEVQEVRAVPLEGGFPESEPL